MQAPTAEPAGTADGSGGLYVLFNGWKGSPGTATVQTKDMPLVDDQLSAEVCRRLLLLRLLLLLLLLLLLRAPPRPRSARHYLVVARRRPALPAAVGMHACRDGHTYATSACARVEVHAAGSALFDSSAASRRYISRLALIWWQPHWCCSGMKSPLMQAWQPLRSRTCTTPSLQPPAMHACTATVARAASRHGVPRRVRGWPPSCHTFLT